MVANQRVQKEMHVVVHVGELERVRERVDATRDKPHRQATATRSARQPDPDAVLSSERVERGAHIIIGARKTLTVEGRDVHYKVPDHAPQCKQINQHA